VYFQEGTEIPGRLTDDVTKDPDRFHRVQGYQTAPAESPAAAPRIPPHPATTPSSTRACLCS
jgi:hypothetical protein